MNRPPSSKSANKTPKERVAVVGSGIAGLSAALAFGSQDERTRPEVTLFERDQPPCTDVPDEAFSQWNRPGVTHLRHSHVFLARLYNLIRDQHPELLRDLLAAGCRELRFTDGLPPRLRAKYKPDPEDDNFTILSSRRTTLELIMRRYVVRQGAVEIKSGIQVHGVLTAGVSESRGAGGSSSVEVQGIRYAPAGVAAKDLEPNALVEEEFDVVVDATGKRSAFAKWLQEAGARIEEQEAPAGILYLTRHYRLLRGQQEPKRGDLPGNGDLGYFKFGVFPADNGNFSITVALPDDEVDLRIAVKKEAGFQRACMQCPGVARWIDPERSEPVSKVYGMGGLVSHWKNYVPEGRPSALGFFAVGDAVIRSNPLYGRGCSSGAIQAHLLAEVLAETADPAERAVRYATAQDQEIRPHYDSMARQDLQSIKRAARERDPNYRPTLKQRLQISFFEHGLRPATRADLRVLRAFMRGFNMLEDPTLALKQPDVLLRILAVWMKPRFMKRDLIPSRLGPTRPEMFRLLGIATDSA